jgi:excisionase family DNA binding protein
MPQPTDAYYTLDPVLNVRQVADALGVHQATVRRLIRSNVIAALKLSRRRIGVRLSELRRYLGNGFDGCAR